MTSSADPTSFFRRLNRLRRFERRGGLLFPVPLIVGVLSAYGGSRPLLDAWLCAGGGIRGDALAAILAPVAFRVAGGVNPKGGIGGGVDIEPTMNGSSMNESENDGDVLGSGVCVTATMYEPHDDIPKPPALYIMAL